MSQNPNSPGVSFALMDARHIAPILSVINIQASFTWFQKFGWKKLWDWGEPPAQHSFSVRVPRVVAKKGINTLTFGPDGDQTSDKGIWMSLWGDDVDEVHRQCLAAGLEVTYPPSDMPRNIREMHVRHPDGHVFRISKGLGSR